MKKLFVLLAALVVLFSFCAVSAEDLNIAYMPNYASLWSVVTGVNMGYFEEEGLNVKLVEFADGPTIIAAMESGSIDMGYIGPGAHKLCIQGRAKIFMLSQIGNADHVLVRHSKGIESYADLKGKKIGYSAGTSSEMILQYALEEAGLTYDDIEAYEMEVSSLVSAMVSGSVDAVAAWSPNTGTIIASDPDDIYSLCSNVTFSNRSVSPASWIMTRMPTLYCALPALCTRPWITVPIRRTLTRSPSGWPISAVSMLRSPRLRPAMLTGRPVPRSLPALRTEPLKGITKFSRMPSLPPALLKVKSRSLTMSSLM